MAHVFIIVGHSLVWLGRTGDAEVNSGYDCPRAESKRNPQYDREPYSEGVSKKRKKKSVQQCWSGVVGCIVSCCSRLLLNFSPFLFRLKVMDRCSEILTRQVDPSMPSKNVCLRVCLWDWTKKNREKTKVGKEKKNPPPKTSQHWVEIVWGLCVCVW